VKLDDIHLAAAILDPKRKRLKFLCETIVALASQERCQQAPLALTEKLCVSQPGSLSNGSYTQNLRNQVDQVSEKCGVQQTLKESKHLLLEDSTDDDEQSLLLPAVSVKQELQAYMCENMKKDPIPYWFKDTMLKYPQLKALATFLLAIPAISASSEQCFLQSGWITNERRS
jgi:hypothetical protein